MNIFRESRTQRQTDINTLAIAHFFSKCAKKENKHEFTSYVVEYVDVSCQQEILQACDNDLTSSLN